MCMPFVLLGSPQATLQLERANAAPLKGRLPTPRYYSRHLVEVLGSSFLEAQTFMYRKRHICI